MISIHPAQRPNTERGAAIIVALFFTIIVVTLTLTGAVSMTAQCMKTRTNFVVATQAVQAARSGLAEGLTWRRLDVSEAFDQPPNAIIASQLMETDERRVVTGQPGYTS